ncbi:hypothetical protein [Streptomyces sp. NPDC048636]|uniref:hypothetical protein n=1 Tax=Streptomyces sp. NPDC048636 TaxID=3155762 RepID=UPI00342F16D8
MPRTHRSLVLGIGAGVAGFTGAIRGVMDGAGLLHILALTGIGVLGVALAVSYVLEYAKR